ncbi:hypothetical protein ACRALDRAFT_2015589 [Sodiomyces alcalophilus JCM 7366]|uniref:uncharacterized protein n=1 Tax=Sodiomyces alcalophilus JCM 7366 TaxID=591952 RepID=UPI0039B42823
MLRRGTIRISAHTAGTFCNYTQASYAPKLVLWEYLATCSEQLEIIFYSSLTRDECTCTDIVTWQSNVAEPVYATSPNGRYLTSASATPSAEGFCPCELSLHEPASSIVTSNTQRPCHSHSHSIYLFLPVDPRLLLSPIIQTSTPSLQRASSHSLPSLTQDLSSGVKLQPCQDPTIPIIYGHTTCSIPSNYSSARFLFILPGSYLPSLTVYSDTSPSLIFGYLEPSHISDYIETSASGELVVPSKVEINFRKSTFGFTEQRIPFRTLYLDPSSLRLKHKGTKTPPFPWKSRQRLDSHPYFAHISSSDDMSISTNLTSFSGRTHSSYVSMFVPLCATFSNHSGRFRYADPQNLPSYPSTGLRKDGAAASAAASLGWANQKSLDPWRPGRSSSASTAAMLAHDSQTPSQTESNASSAGAAAALRATASARKLQQQQQDAQQEPEHLRRHRSISATSQSTAQTNLGNSAATQAFRSSLSGRRPAQTSTQHTSDPNNARALGSLSAAKSVMSPSRRPRSVSTPITRADAYPAQSRASANALSAATTAHKPSMKPASSINRAGSVPYTLMPRTMFTSHPTIGPEAEDQKRADMLHASAVAMAKKMYSHQQKMTDQAKEASQQATSDTESTTNVHQPTRYVNLQEAAYKLAQERLAKLEQEHQQAREYQDYYGGIPARRNTLQRRFTLKGRLGRRSYSDDDDLDDRKQSERIREQMSIFSTNLSKVDEQKRAKDREALLAAAQRNVRARLQGLDEKVFADTGKLPPPKRLSEWELKAHEAALALHESRDEHQDKINLGGGMYLSHEDVDAIAAKRVQPVLDEINEKAAKERERQEVLRMEAEAKRIDDEKRKERDKEIREINRKIVGKFYVFLSRVVPLARGDRHTPTSGMLMAERERKQREKEEQKGKKEEERVKREEERAAKAEEKRLAKEEKRKSRAAERQAMAVGGQHTGEDVPDDTDSDENEAMPTIHTSQPVADAEAAHPAGDQQSATSPAKESTSPTHKMRSWLKSRFGRARGKSPATEESHRPGFIGGAALNSRLAHEGASTRSLDNTASSMREVATAGTGGRRRSRTVGSGRWHDSLSVDMLSRSSNANEDALGRGLGCRTASSDGEGGEERPITPPAKMQDPAEQRDDGLSYLFARWEATSWMRRIAFGRSLLGFEKPISQLD